MGMFNLAETISAAHDTIPVMPVRWILHCQRQIEKNHYQRSVSTQKLARLRNYRPVTMSLLDTSSGESLSPGASGMTRYIVLGLGGRDTSIQRREYPI